MTVNVKRFIRINENALSWKTHFTDRLVDRRIILGNFSSSEIVDSCLIELLALVEKLHSAGLTISIFGRTDYKSWALWLLMTISISDHCKYQQELLGYGQQLWLGIWLGSDTPHYMFKSLSSHTVKLLFAEMYYSLSFNWVVQIIVWRLLLQILDLGGRGVISI